MKRYGTWIAVKEKDAFLEDFLQNIRTDTTKANLRDRPSLSLRWVDGQIELRMAERVLEERFRRMQAGESILAVSSALIEDIELFHERRLQYLASRFLVICGGCPLNDISAVEKAFIQAAHEKLRDDPYRNRLIRIYKTDSGASLEKLVKIDSNVENPNLWLDPVWIDLDDAEVESHFNGCFCDTKGSFIFPPCRTKEASGQPKQYFDEALVDRRADIRRYFEESADLRRDARKVSVARTILRLIDDWSVQDVLLDGGDLDWTCQEGTPTELSLHISGGGAPAAPYRSMVLLQPDSSHEQEWARDMARAIGDDIRSLLPGRGLHIHAKHRELPRIDWSIDRNAGGRPREGEHSDGSYQLIEHLQNTLSKVDTDPLDALVLIPAALNVDEPDHHKAELLFMEAFWKCPSIAKNHQLAWRQAFRRLLRQELRGERLGTIKERIELWNRECGDPAPFRLANEKVPWVNYLGLTLEWQASTWRLQLPWRAIVTTKCLILNDPERSRLGFGNVIAKEVKLPAEV